MPDEAGKISSEGMGGTFCKGPSTLLVDGTSMNWIKHPGISETLAKIRQKI